MFSITKSYTTYLKAISICIFINVVGIALYKITQEEKEKVILNLVHDNIKNLVINDIQNALSKAYEEKTFLILKNHGLIKKNSKNIKTTTSPKIKQITQYAIYINSANGNILIDLQEFKELIDKLLPNYVSYKIAINHHELAISKHYNNDPKIKDNCKINNDITLSIDLGIDRSSKFYETKKANLITFSAIILLISIFSTSFILFWYLKRKSLIKTRIKILKGQMKDLSNKNEAFIKNKKYQQILKKIFIKKATEMFIKEQAGSGKKDLVYSNLEPDEYLFPIRLSDCSPSKIEIQKLFHDITDFFSCYFEISSLRLNKEVDYIDIPCGVEVFYQIMFSLIYNISVFIEEQSSRRKKVDLIINSTMIKISFESFPLNEEKMIVLSNSFQKEYIDVFLLNFGKLFQSLKENKIDYVIYSENKSKNIIEIKLTKEIFIKDVPIKEKNLDNVLNFPKNFKKKKKYNEA